MQFPMIVETDHLSVIQSPREHIPNTDGVLHVTIKGCSYYYVWLKPTTQPTTQPSSIIKKVKLSPIPLTPFTKEPIFDFNFDFFSKKYVKGTIRKLKKRKVNASGSCFIVAKQYGYYYAVTARHVVIIPEAKIFIDQQQGEIVSILNLADIAILRFKSNKTYPIYKSSINSKVLDKAWLVGYPADVTKTVRKFTVKGNVCNVSKTEIWFSGGGARGMSGGPMLNDKDEVVGVISRFLPSIVLCDNFINSVPSRFFKYEVETILSKERIKNLINRINILEKKKF